MKYWVALAPIKDPRCPNGAPSLGKCRATLSPKLVTIIPHPTPKSKRRFSARAVPAVPFVPVVPPRAPDNGRAGRSIRPARFMPCQCASVRRSPARASLHPCGWSRRPPWSCRLRGGSSACQVYARPWGPSNCVACSRGWLCRVGPYAPCVDGVSPPLSRIPALSFASWLWAASASDQHMMVLPVPPGRSASPATPVAKHLPPPGATR